ECVGRGMGSGRGKKAGNGHEGHNGRAGGAVRRGCEGGQKSLAGRLRESGFRTINGKEVAVVNLSRLNRCEDGAEVTPELLLETCVISKINDGVKILASGAVDKKLTVKAHKFASSAK
ncbi:UNVERIFIED_CONTAM: 50S ribosomal protein L15, partial [Bacillus cereus]